MTRKNMLGLVAVSGRGADRAGAEEAGNTDTPMLPGQPWHVHDSGRPHPNHVTPGAVLGAPSSDAVVLFDGKDLKHWTQMGRGADRGKEVAVKWAVKDGYFECAPRTGDLVSATSSATCGFISNTPRAASCVGPVTWPGSLHSCATVRRRTCRGRPGRRCGARIRSSRLSPPT